MNRRGFAAGLVVGAAMLAWASVVQATPIVYEGTLFDDLAVAGVNTQPPSSQSNPEGADYWSFFATAGDTVTIFGDRQAGHYDMSFWVLFGTFADTAAFGGSFDGGDAPFVDFADDEDPANIAGPFGDPRSVFIAPFTGFYTLAVTNFLSSAGPPNPYTLQADGVQAVPEPASLLLLGTGLAAAGVRRRLTARRKV